MKNNPRFLEKEEYAATAALFRECFGDDEEFMEEYYGLAPDGSGVIYSGLVAALSDDAGKLISMAQVLPVVMEADGREQIIPYIMGVCTAESMRHKGCMDSCMKLVTDRLKRDGYPWCCLVPVNPDIYRHLGFTHGFRLDDAAKELLYADDGLEFCCAKLLNTDKMPDSIRVLCHAKHF